jgi:hypothetical protein
MYPLWVFTDEAQQQWEVLFLRDIFGNPFRPINLDRAWLTPRIISFGQAVYEERAFDRLPLLADALEEVGCTDDNILDHLRLPGPHTRGCWPLDAILGKV